MNPKVLPILAAIISGLLVGANIVASRFVIEQTTPAQLAFMRYTLGFVFLLIPLIFSERRGFVLRDLVPIGLLGITQFGILVVLNYAVQFIPSARSALIFATMPLLTMILGALFRSEEFTWLKSLGVILTIVDVGLALGEKALDRGAGHSWIGEGLAFASALSGAICSILYRPYLHKYPTVQISAFAMLASVGFLALWAGGEGFFGSIPYFTTGGWLAILFVGLSSGVGYYCWLWALNHASPTRVTVFLSLSPITATVLGVLLLDETITGLFVVGLVCVAAGLWFATR